MQGSLINQISSSELSRLGIIRTWMGRPGPDFEITALDGRSVSLRSVRGNIVLLNFWTTWCGACAREMPTMEQLYRAFPDEAFAILAVNMRESAAKVEAFRNKFQITFTVLLDRTGAVGDSYGVLAIPATFILDRQGKMIGKATGAQDWASPPALQFIRKLIGSPVN